MLSWVFLGTLLTLCAVLGVLQYRWIDEVSVAARERLRGSLQASLFRIGFDLNSEISAAWRALSPAVSEDDPQVTEKDLVMRYQVWQQSARHRHMFRRIAIARAGESGTLLRMLDLDRGTFRNTDWPADWSGIERRTEFFGGPHSGGPPRMPPDQGSDGLVFEAPLLPRPQEHSPGGPFVRGMGWLIGELNLDYVRQTMLPEVLQHYLGTNGSLDYQVEVLTRATPPAVVYESDPDVHNIAAHADASVNLLDEPFVFRFRGPGGGRGMGSDAGFVVTSGLDGGPNPGPGRGPGPNPGRWQMFVRHRSGSLEVLVAQTRRRNLAVTAGVLLLMVTAIGALLRYTRRAQALAAAQMDFVAGVSHELRTPLTVIYTAGYNLQGKMAANPAQVAKYGALIQKESGRLRELVEKVLTFRGAEAGRVIQEPEPVSVETAIDEAIESSRIRVESSGCVIEKKVASDLPPVMGDAMALSRALENLVGNAAKYGASGGGWIGIEASRIGGGEKAEVEIRVSDRGPGIPEHEQKRIFEPFFRGARAVADQIHGTGLGLSLVKEIVEAHGGTIQVKSAPMHGAEFIVRIPAAPSGAPQ